jgi:CPA1 family monovalent cation:H+ antiporter
MGHAVPGGNTIVAEETRVVILVFVALAVALGVRRLRVPYTLALVLVGLLLGFFHILPDIQFNPELVLFLFLPALLFEGAWNLNTNALLADWRAVALLAVPGLGISLVVVGLVVHWATGLPLLVALLLGAIVSPTDPVAVIGLLRQLGMPARLRTIVDGESLFNDGVGAAAYQLILGFLLVDATHGGIASTGSLAGVLLKGVWLFVGGPLLGLPIGFLVSRFTRHVDDHLIETTITFGVAYGSYLLGVIAGTSGLLTVVSASLVLSSYGRRIGMSRRTRHAVDDIWEFVGYLANSLLFLLLGHQIGAADMASAVPTIAWTVAAVIAGRAVMVYGMLGLHDGLLRLAGRRAASKRPPTNAQAAAVPTLWRPLILLSGLRGALSIALALTLPAGIADAQQLERTVYGVVLVTLVGQGIGLRLLLPRWPRGEPAAA